MVSVNRLRGLWAMMPNRITLTYKVYSGDDTWSAGTAVPDSEERPSDLNEHERRALEISASARTNVFHVWKDKLGSIEPDRHDQVVYQSRTWHVESVTDELAGQRFRLVCTEVR